MRAPRIIRDLWKGGDDAILTHLLSQMRATLEGAQLAQELAAGIADSEWSRQKMRDIEHKGDNSRANLVAEISRSLTTPIDREDLFRLSRAIDDILDSLRDFVREYDLFGTDLGDLHPHIFTAIIDSVRELERSLYHLPSHAGEAAMTALSAKKVAGTVRRMYQESLASLLAGEVTGEVLKQRELLHRLDLVGQRLGVAADALTDGATKRGH